VNWITLRRFGPDGSSGDSIDSQPVAADIAKGKETFVPSRCTFHLPQENMRHMAYEK
jgi:hypothetical protein